MRTFPVVMDAIAQANLHDKLWVVDSGSTDGTIDFATASGATVMHRDWDGMVGQRQLLLDEQIVSFSRKNLVFFLLHDKNNVSRHGSRRLVRFAVEHNLLVVHHPFLDVHFQNFLLLDHFLRFTTRTLVFFRNRLPIALTIRTNGLHLLHHARSDLSNDQLHAGTGTRSTRPQRA